MAYEFSNARLPADTGIGVIGSKVLGEFSVTLPLSAAGSAVTQILYTAPYPVNVTKVQSRFGVASSSGTYVLEKLPSGTASGSGTAMNVAAALSGTADTNLTTALIANTTTLAAGDSLNVIFAGTMTGLVKAGITVSMQRI